MNPKTFPEYYRRAAIDPDGNVIRLGMTAMADGDRWTVGYAAPKLVRLDRLRDDGRKESYYLGRRSFRLIQLLG